MICPHCTVSFHPEPDVTFIAEDIDGGWDIFQTRCPACARVNLVLRNGSLGPKTMGYHLRDPIGSARLIHPRGTGRAPVPAEVPPNLAGLYQEAASILADSARASAALSRRTLQQLLHDYAGAIEKDLFDQIQHVIDGNSLPSHLRDDIDAVRSIGNMAAHPLKSTASGEIVEVEPGEAEWNLDVLDGLFDFYFVQPARAAARRAAHNEKLTDAGKPPIR